MEPKLSLLSLRVFLLPHRNIYLNQSFFTIYYGNLNIIYTKY